MQKIIYFKGERMLPVYIIITLLLLISVGVYLYIYFLRSAVFWNKGNKNKKINILAALFAVFASICSMNIFGLCALVILHIIGIALVTELLNLLYLAVSGRHSKKNMWENIYRSGLVPVIITGIILSCGYYSMGNIKETDYTIYTDKAIRQQGYRVAMIADLHFGTTMDVGKLKKYADEIEEKKPDMVVLCGDIVDQRTTLPQMESAAKVLGNIKSTYGTIYIYGNHDKSRGSNRNFSEEQLRNNLINSGITVLEDEIKNINSEFTVIGRKDKGFSSENNRKPIAELLNKADTQSFLLLLDHQPSGLQENSTYGVDLQLSGHTHGGQIWPAGVLNGIFGIGELNYGYKKINKSQFIVSSGMAGWGYPIRTGSKSEFVIIDLFNK
jgi:Predicted phosphohydrolases